MHTRDNLGMVVAVIPPNDGTLYQSSGVLLNPTGTLPELINLAAAFLTMYIQVSAEIVGFKRIDTPEYSLEALREAVVNAVVHRDYSLDRETIRIFFYTDRVEIHSPGLLPPGVTLTDLVQMRAPSRPRNVLLAGFLRDLPEYMKCVGAGIRFMVHEVRALDLPDPEFREQHEFLVIFRRSGGQPRSGKYPVTPPTHWSSFDPAAR